MLRLFLKSLCFSFFLVCCFFSAGCVSYSSFHPVFNGTDLSGFTKTGNAAWKVQNNAITGYQKPDKPGGGYLVTKHKWKNFELLFEFKMVPHTANSGVIIRDPDAGKSDPGESGYEIQILDRTNVLYKTGSVIGLAQSINAEPVRGWNTMKILAYNELVQVHLNGKRVTEALGLKNKKGHICFQCYPGRLNKLSRSLFRNIRIRPLYIPPPEIEDAIKKIVPEKKPETKPVPPPPG